MIYVLVMGQLAADPQRRTAASGKDFATCSIRSGSGDEAQFVSVMAFGEAADRLLPLNKGDAISVAGRGELRSWIGTDGSERTGLSVVVSEIAALRPRPRVREATPQRQRPELQPLDDGPPLDDPIDDLYAGAR